MQGISWLCCPWLLLLLGNTAFAAYPWEFGFSSLRMVLRTFGVTQTFLHLPNSLSVDPFLNKSFDSKTEAKSLLEQDLRQKTMFKEFKSICNGRLDRKMQKVSRTPSGSAAKVGECSTAMSELKRGFNWPLPEKSIFKHMKTSDVQNGCESTASFWP